MPKIIIYLTLALIFGAGVLLGSMSRLPGKSEAHAILEKHGTFDAVKDSYFIYLPNNRFMSVEEFEAMTVVSSLYEHIDIVFPKDATGNIVLRN
jgi:hypothetical protein